eukprot:7379978-Prymnesium_polylepis.1
MLPLLSRTSITSISVSQSGTPGGEAGGGFAGDGDNGESLKGGGGGEYGRMPQSSQSEPKGQARYSEPGPPSSHSPSDA